MLAVEEKAEEALEILSSAYDITEDNDETFGESEENSEIFVRIDSLETITEEEISDVLDLIEDENCRFHVSVMDNLVGILIEEI